MVALMAFCAHASGPGPDALLRRAEQAKLDNRAEFVETLGTLTRGASGFDAQQRWHVRFLVAWEAAYRGKLDKAGTILDDIIDHSGDETLTARAMALKINILSRSKNYVRAYELSDRLNQRLPGIHDPQARREAIANIAQMYTLAQQPALALSYIQQMSDGSTDCASEAYSFTIRMNAGKVGASSPELMKAIHRCLAEGATVYANSMRLNRALLTLYGGHTRPAIAQLERIKPSVLGSGFIPHITEIYAVLAQAYLASGDGNAARQSAQEALSASKGKLFSWPQEIAYQVLYKVEQAAGHDAAALAYLEKFADQQKAAMDDAKARTLAYQMVKQELENKRLRLDALSKQNRVLRLRQRLDEQEARTHMLLIGLLIATLALAGMWLYRLRRSHQRLSRIAREDGLTGVLNHQHFFAEAERKLLMHRAAGTSTTMVLIDLDHFKQVNDTHGHYAGDAVLRRAAKTCRQQLRDVDLVGRLGGEEFGMLIAAVSAEAATEITQRVREAIAACRTALANGTIISVTASFGLAHSEDSCATLQQLYAAADTALYRAKHGGRNQLRISGENDGDAVATSSGRMIPR